MYHKHFHHITNMTISGINNQGVRFTVNVRIMEGMKLFIHMKLVSTRTPAIIKYEGIVKYTYGDLFVPFDFNSFENNIIANFLFAYNGVKIDEIDIVDIVQRLDLFVLENHEIIGMDVIEPYVFNKNFTV
ncbi:C1 protein [Malvastrum yellow vein betasatellite]|uniref:C1 protein n=1 Tax=Malvastrum yellow vein betasatellite TaxID=221036 RepID=A0A0D5MC91_9VIRU|nr:C1 protein [Malvastrum yellow vein betasatellite]AJY58096.1 C1 protein [Malvastrum yellow vein betasatellite]